MSTPVPDPKPDDRPDPLMPPAKRKALGLPPMERVSVDPTFRLPPDPTSLCGYELRMTIVQLKKAGWNLWQIANALGRSKKQVEKILYKELGRMGKELAKVTHELFTLEYERMEEMWRYLWDKCMSPTRDWKAWDSLLRLQERRCKLFGWDAPVKIQSQVDVSIENLSDAEIIERARDIGLLLPGELPPGLPAYLPGEEIPDADFVPSSLPAESTPLLERSEPPGPELPPVSPAGLS